VHCQKPLFRGRSVISRRLVASASGARTGQHLASGHDSFDRLHVSASGLKCGAESLRYEQRASSHNLFLRFHVSIFAPVVGEPLHQLEEDSFRPRRRVYGGSPFGVNQFTSAARPHRLLDAASTRLHGAGDSRPAEVQSPAAASAGLRHPWWRYSDPRPNTHQQFFILRISAAWRGIRNGVAQAEVEACPAADLFQTFVHVGAFCATAPG